MFIFKTVYTGPAAVSRQELQDHLKHNKDRLLTGWWIISDISNLVVHNNLLNCDLLILNRSNMTLLQSLGMNELIK